MFNYVELSKISTSYVKDSSVNKFKENIESFFERFIKVFKDS